MAGRIIGKKTVGAVGIACLGVAAARMSAHPDQALEWGKEWGDVITGKDYSALGSNPEAMAAGILIGVGLILLLIAKGMQSKDELDNGAKAGNPSNQAWMNNAGPTPPPPVLSATSPPSRPSPSAPPPYAPSPSTP